jgi:hypothetical protein
MHESERLCLTFLSFATFIPSGHCGETPAFPFVQPYGISPESDAVRHMAADFYEFLLNPFSGR